MYRSLLQGPKKNNINIFSINVLKGHSERSQKFLLEKVYVRNSLCLK